MANDTTTALHGYVQVAGAPRDAITRAKAVAKVLFGQTPARFEAACTDGWTDVSSGDICFHKTLVLDVVPFVGHCVLARVDDDVAASTLRANNLTITITIRGGV